MLMEHETTKLKEQEELYTRELKEWKAHLKPRKQVFYLCYYICIFRYYLYMQQVCSFHHILFLMIIGIGWY